MCSNGTWSSILVFIPTMFRLTYTNCAHPGSFSGSSRGEGSAVLPEPESRNRPFTVASFTSALAASRHELDLLQHVL